MRSRGRFWGLAAAALAVILVPSLARAGRSIVLTGDVVAGELVLQWTGCLGAAAYWVYGADNDAYFAAGGAPGYQHRLAVLSPLVRTWSSPAGIGDEDHNWTYMVLAVDQREHEIDQSNRFGEFDFEFGHGCGWVAVGLPLDNAGLLDAEAVGQSIPHCGAAATWDEPSHTWVQHDVGFPWGNFGCAVTMPLFAYTTDNGVWTLTGSVIDSAAYMFDLLAGWNFITVPLNRNDLQNVELLGQDIPNCTVVSQWEAWVQGWVSHIVGWPWNPWSVHVGHPYMVYCTAPGTWGGAVLRP